MEAALVEKEAMRLSEAERALLADRLMESLSLTPEPLRNAWVREAEARMQAYREGKIEAVDGPTAMSQLRSRFAQ